MRHTVIEHRTKKGDLIDRTGICLIPDNHVDKFTISIRSMQGVSVEQVRDHLQKLWEVNNINHDLRTTYCQNS